MTDGDKPRDVEGLIQYAITRFGLDISSWREPLTEAPVDEVTARLYDQLARFYADKEQKMGLEQIRYLERMFLLHTIDSKWKEHLYAMDRLKEGMGLRALGQRDPLVEFKREGYHMFRAMFESIHIDVAELIFKLRPAEQETRVRSVFGSQQQTVHHEFGGMTGAVQLGQVAEERPVSGARPPAPSAQAHQVVSGQKKIGRNDDCPCGSGKKYKKCCGK